MQGLFQSVIVSLALAGAGLAQSSLDGPLRAGAAKVDITPPQSAMKYPADIIRDHLFVRAIVIDNGKTCAVIVGMDINSARGDIVKDSIARTKSVGCPADNYLITATRGHTSSSTGITGGRPTNEEVTDAIVKAIEAAKAKLEPAKVGYGTTALYLNTNRDLYEGGKWYQGVNPTGSSDKTLSVLALIGNDNKPIGVLMNYSMHVINFYLTGVLSADYPGAASRWVERRFDERTVAIYTQSAIADQNQRFHDLSYKFAGYRVHDKVAQNEGIIGPSTWKVEASAPNTNAVNVAALETPVPPEDVPGYKAAYELTGELVSAVGVMIGESAIEVMKMKIPDYADTAKIYGAREDFECPGRDRVVEPGVTPIREGVASTFKDGPPVAIRVGVLRIGDINFAYVNGDIYSQIGLRIKAESPAAKTMVVSVANGFGAVTPYIPSNEAYSHLTFQMVANRVKPGCAEDRIVGTTIGLMRKAP